MAALIQASEKIKDVQQKLGRSNVLDETRPTTVNVFKTRNNLC